MIYSVSGVFRSLWTVRLQRIERLWTECSPDHSVKQVYRLCFLSVTLRSLGQYFIPDSADKLNIRVEKFFP